MQIKIFKTFDLMLTACCISLLSLVLGYGAVVTFKHHRGGGGLLHSHAHLYPEDMADLQQQQVINTSQSSNT